MTGAAKEPGRRTPAPSSVVRTQQPQVTEAASGCARRLTAATERLAQDAEHIGVIEDDPVGFYDSTIHEKNPQLRPLFSF